MKKGIEYFGIDYQAAENRLYEIAETRQKMGYKHEDFKGEKRVLQYLLRVQGSWQGADADVAIQKAIKGTAEANGIDVDLFKQYSLEFPWLNVGTEKTRKEDHMGNLTRKKVSVATVDKDTIRERLALLGFIDIDAEMKPEVQLRALMMTLKHESGSKTWEDLINCPWDCHIQAAGGYKSMWRKIAQDMKQRGIIKVVREAGKKGDRHKVDTALLKNRMEELQRVIEMKGGRCSEVLVLKDQECDDCNTVFNPSDPGVESQTSGDGDICPSCEQTRIAVEIAEHRTWLASTFKTSMGSGPPPGEVAASIIYGHATALAGSEHIAWLQEQIRNAKKLTNEPTRYMQWMKASELLSRVESRVKGVKVTEDGLLLSNYQQARLRLEEMTEE
jgi:hypothetical protein